MKYLYNDMYFDEEAGGPIFFYTGNEGDIEWFAQNTGFMWDIAPEFGALLVFAEHRYYGSSLPFGNDSFSSPEKSGYLTSEQALADFADFLLWFKRTRKGVQDSPVIAFGGSYGGMLTAWMRIKYPHVIQGGIAASAPVLQFQGITACNVFNQIVTKDFDKASPNCSASVRKSWDVLNRFGKNDAGREWLSSTWRLCEPLKSEDDIGNLKNWLVEVYGNLAMVDYPYPASFLEPLPANPIKVVCESLNDPQLTDKFLLKSLFKAVSVYFNYTGSSSCLDVSKQDSGSLGDLGWGVQSCNEMVMPMCSDGVTDMFEPTLWNYTSYEQNCLKQFGLRPRPNMAELIYGGRNIRASSNIVFSNGLLDPWSGGGVLESMSDSLIAVIIPEGAHHLDLRAAHADDPASVTKARRTERTQIRKWISDYYNAQRLTNEIALPTTVKNTSSQEYDMVLPDTPLGLETDEDF